MGQSLVSIDRSRPVTFVFLCIVLSSFLVATDGLAIRLIRRDKVDTDLFPKNLSDVEKHRIYADLSHSRALRFRQQQLTDSADLSNPSLNQSARALGVNTISPKLQQALSSLFVVRVDIGSQPYQAHLLFDTGSSFTWVQCTGCRPRCFDIQGGPFNTIRSSSYRLLVKNGKDKPCLPSPPGPQPNPGQPCGFRTRYETGHTVAGIVSLDNAHFTTKAAGSTETVQDFLFGCATSAPEKMFFDNDGPNNKIAGVLGIGINDRLDSFMQRHDSITKMKFSYCLPPWDDRKLETNVLFGDDVPQIPPTAKTTQLKKLLDYTVVLEGISVAGKRLDLQPGQFNRGVLLDTGSPSTYLQDSAYKKIEEAFERELADRMRPLKPPPLKNLYKLCYRSRSRRIANPPSLTYHFADGADLVVEYGNLFKEIQDPKYGGLLCLMINPSGGGPDIIGAVNQANHHFVYNLRDKTLSFYEGKCGKN